jgi:CO/xanthine dehydrogenase Mo-binding subunit
MAIEQDEVQVSAPPITHERVIRTVGKSVIRKDAVPKVTGRAVYAGDLSLPGMLWGKVLLSDHPTR